MLEMGGRMLFYISSTYYFTYVLLRTQKKSTINLHNDYLFRFILLYEGFPVPQSIAQEVTHP